MKKPNFLAPYQIWWYEVPNDSSLDVINSKIRPILILETYVDEEEIKRLLSKQFCKFILFTFIRVSQCFGITLE